MSFLGQQISEKKYRYRHKLFPFVVHHRIIIVISKRELFGCMCGLALIRIMAKMSEKESMHQRTKGRSFFTIYIFSDTLMTRWRQQEIGVRIKKFNQFGNEKRGKRCLLKTRALALNRGRILASARVKLIRHLQYFFHGSPR